MKWKYDGKNLNNFLFWFAIQIRATVIPLDESMTVTLQSDEDGEVTTIPPSVAEEDIPAAQPSIGEMLQDVSDVKPEMDPQEAAQQSIAESDPVTTIQPEANNDEVTYEPFVTFRPEEDDIQKLVTSVPDAIMNNPPVAADEPPPQKIEDQTESDSFATESVMDETTPFAPEWNDPATEVFDPVEPVPSSQETEHSKIHSADDSAAIIPQPELLEIVDDRIPEGTTSVPEGFDPAVEELGSIQPSANGPMLPQPEAQLAIIEDAGIPEATTLTPEVLDPADSIHVEEIPGNWQGQSADVAPEAQPVQDEIADPAPTDESGTENPLRRSDDESSSDEEDNSSPEFRYDDILINRIRTIVDSLKTPAKETSANFFRRTSGFITSVFSRRTNAKRSIPEESDLPGDVVRRLDPAFLQFLRSQPLPMRRALSPNFSGRFSRQMEWSDSSLDDDEQCDLHIRVNSFFKIIWSTWSFVLNVFQHPQTDPGLHLLLTFHNMSAPYTVDCSGAYVEIEREGNGFEARWCGNPIGQQRGVRSHVIFARSEVRVSVYHDRNRFRNDNQNGLDENEPPVVTGFSADIEVIDLHSAGEYKTFQRSEAYSSVHRRMG